MVLNMSLDISIKYLFHLYHLTDTHNEQMNINNTDTSHRGEPDMRLYQE